MSNLVTRLFAGFMLALIACVASADGERGWFGFASKMEATGMVWNPVLASITIDEIVLDSPAAMAGVAKGDQVLAFDGKAIAGSNARDIESIFEHKAPGEKLVAVLKHLNGDQYTATMIAAKSPTP